MSIASKYDPASVEGKWYSIWLDSGIFHSEPDDREPYSIVIPPPNVTGVLHMGHILNNTIQDILIRRARMLGKNACWVPGTDHASIATEAKVVNLLAGQGIDKREIGREAFLEHAWKWKEKHDGIITGQLKKLGASCDWDRLRFTMDDGLYKAVIQAFIQLYDEGLIYRGARMINWDPRAKTALSDEEVLRKEVNSKLYFVKYRIAGSEKFLTIATTRPETILGDTAICVHPEDKRYGHLKGKKVIIPVVEREVPVIFDAYVDMEFGSGALKVTPAHDLNDYELGLKHKLETIDTLNEDGTISQSAGHYIGKDRFEARKLIVDDLEKAGLIARVEDIKNNVGFSERNPDTVVEPRISTQWFLKMDELVKPAIKAVKDGEIRIHPDKFTKVYNNWLENIRDWCISRQLWWGHRIPAWYAPDGSFVVAGTAEEALEKFKKDGKNIGRDEIRQDEDVLDTWFSSWLWPFSVFNWNEDPENRDLKYYYPTNELVTGHDIIFFWVARMIMAGYHFTGKKPFSNVYFTGMVRDGQGRKMSKSLGNSPDALKLIENYGADGVRVGMMLCAPAGNDLPFDESLCKQGRNFANKIWNAYRLMDGWSVDNNQDPEPSSEIAADWFESRISQVIEELDSSFVQYRISESLMIVYKLIWDDFCSWYLEMIKPEYGKALDGKTYEKTRSFFDTVLRLAHPFMPFISEEIWQNLMKPKTGESITLASWPVSGTPDVSVIAKMRFNQDLISHLRQIRKEENIPVKEEIDLFHSAQGNNLFIPVIQKLCLVQKIEKGQNSPENARAFLVDKAEFYVPLSQDIDPEKEKQRIQKELDYTRGFLKSVEKKLENQDFIANAPEKVVETEKRKKEDAESKIKILKQQLQAL